VPSLPVVELSGSPFQEGVDHGRRLRNAIARNLELYFDRFAAEAGMVRARVLDLAARYGLALEGHSPAYAAGVRGIASGSGFSPAEIVALNVRYEILYSAYAAGARGDGCTAFAVLPSAARDGHLRLAQNWDWIPGVQGAILHSADRGGLVRLAFTEAGVFGGKIGLNSAGLGLAVNGLAAFGDGWERLAEPFHVTCYRLLGCRTLDEALGVLKTTGRACSANFLLAQFPDQALNVETTPAAIFISAPEGGRLAHANHFTHPESAGTPSPRDEWWQNSCRRDRRLRSLIEAAPRIGREEIEAFLRDHDGYPESICRHLSTGRVAEDQYVTGGSFIIDLHTRTLSFTGGPPCEEEYVENALAQ
jgi:isopenicillin-N N-acyltransferase like protein